MLDEKFSQEPLSRLDLLVLILIKEEIGRGLKLIMP